MTQTILVAGGAGYVGAHACKALAASGYEPVVFDNLSTGHREFVQWGRLIEGDIRDTAALTAAMIECGAVAVMHFAADAYVRESVVDPARYYDNNVVGSLSLLRAMRSAGCGKIVFSSTCAVYGDPASVPITEATALAPTNPYGASKMMVERILADYDVAYGLRSICLRYFNACGADEAQDAGEWRDPETHLIARAMMALQGYVSDFTVFGSDFDTPDGTAIRDYIHVADLADAHVQALAALLGGAPSGIYNLGTGTGHSVKQVLEAVQAVTGRTLPAVAGGRQPGEAARLVADAGLAQRVLGFAPTRSDLSRIVGSAWAWHQKAHPHRATDPISSGLTP